MSNYLVNFALLFHCSAARRAPRDHVAAGCYQGGASRGPQPHGSRVRIWDGLAVSGAGGAKRAACGFFLATLAIQDIHNSYERRPIARRMLMGAQPARAASVEAGAAVGVTMPLPPPRANPPPTAARTPERSALPVSTSLPQGTAPWAAAPLLQAPRSATAGPMSEPSQNAAPAPSPSPEPGAPTLSGPAPHPSQIPVSALAAGLAEDRSGQTPSASGTS